MQRLLRVSPLRLAVLGLLPVLVPVVTPAADLVEPWERGVSNAEIHFSFGDGSADTAAALLGMGLPAGFSLGAAITEAEDGAAGWGLIGMFTRRFGAFEMDLVGELGRHRASHEAETHGDWLAGTEWSFHRYRLVPYVRATAVGDPESGGYHGLVGLMAPVTKHLELHVELASEAPLGGSWPLHLAVGPNILLPGGVEILPEISMVRDRATGATDWLFTVGLIFNPQSLRSSGAATR
jgi:hypothetical protein